MIDTEKKKKSWCNAVIWNKEESSHLFMKGIQSSIAIAWIGLTAEMSRADNLSVSSTYQLDLAAELRIDGCGRGFNPHSCPLGEDTITIPHSHSSANAPLLSSPPHRVPLITDPSLCQRTCI